MFSSSVISGEDDDVVATETTMARAITPTKRHAFARDGYVVLRAFYTENDIARLNAALAAAPLPTVDEVGRQLARDSFIGRRSPDVASFACDPLLGEAAAALLGVGGVRLIHDVLLERSRAHVPTEWHRDRDFWSMTGGGAITMWIPLRPTPRSMGPLRYARRSHLARSTAPLRRIFKLAIPARFAVASYDLAVGDVVAHHYETLHSAGRNRTETTRRAFAIHFTDADATFVESPGAGHREHAARCNWDLIANGAHFPNEIAPLVFLTRSASRLVALSESRS